MKRLLVLLSFLALVAPAAVLAEDLVVFTASQGFFSRIYVMHEDGTTRYFHYDYYRWADLAVVDGEVYAADAIAPRVYKVDIDTGDIELVIDDISLYYFYGLAFDGQYWYVKEWNLRRYDADGKYQGGAEFAGKVFGMAWDGQYLWTLDGESQVKAWDVSAWPELRLVKTIAPPTPDCRGLHFDGECFWTAESKEDDLGKIFRFDAGGNVTSELVAPAWVGWSACVVRRPNRSK